MSRNSTLAVSLRALLAGALVVFFAPATEAGVLDKLKKQLKETVDKGKDDVQQTLEQETGLESSGSADALRADAERMWKLCYEQSLAGEEYSKCATVCNMARQSIADFDGAAKANQKTHEQCKNSYDTALASGKPHKVQSAKEKELGMPAGAMSSDPAAQKALPESAATQATSATAATSSADAKASKKSASGKAAAKPVATPVASKPATLDPMAKAEVDKFAASCPTEGALTTTYDCACLAEEYGNTLMNQRADQLADWQNNRKAYEEGNLERAKKMAAERNDPRILEQAQKRYDDAYALWHKVPARDEVYNRLLGESGTGKRCYSRPAIVKTQTQRCLETPGKKTGMGTPTDATYCGCLANEMASNILDKGMQFGPAHNQANLSCDPKVSGVLKGAKN